MDTCCSNQVFEFVADASHADGCEFTLGKCENCRAWLIHCFHTATVHEGTCAVAETTTASAILALQSKELKAFMRDWYRALATVPA